jgi:ABC-type nitrate/sulfonate/bicarbonate transport system permease component
VSGKKLKPDVPVWVEKFHLARALCWIPLTLLVFGIHAENVVAITLLYSAYANVESGLATWQGRRAERRSVENP